MFARGERRKVRAWDRIYCVTEVQVIKKVESE